MNIEFTQPISEKLISLREKQLFCDLTFRLANNSEVKYHSHVLAAHCKLLSNNEASVIEVPDFNGPALDLFSEVMNVLYGKGSLVINKTNSQLLQQLGEFLQCEELTAFCSQVATSEEGDETKEFNVSPQDILTALRGRTCDCTITYRGVSIEIHRFLLAALFDYFVEKWTLDCPDRNDQHLDFTDKFQFSSAEFMFFLNNVYEEVVAIDSCHFYATFLLGRYFKYSELMEHVTNNLPSLEPNTLWVTQALAMANDHDDLEFIDLFVQYLNNCSVCSIDEPMILKPHILKSLCQGIECEEVVIWLVKSLVSCYKAHSLHASELTECLALLDLKRCDVTRVYYLLEDFRGDVNLKDNLTLFYSGTILPLLVQSCSSKTDSFSDYRTLLKKYEDLQLQMNRDRILSLYKYHRNSPSFFALTPGLSYLEGSVYIQGCRTLSTAWIAHPLDGRLLINLIDFGEETRIGFFNTFNSEFVGLKFKKNETRIEDNSAFIVLFQDKPVGLCSFRIAVTLSMNFSKSLVASFSLLTPSLDCSAHVPLNSGLLLTLLHLEPSVRHG
ncbi:hypothetical protein RCL1_006068 [Eukaryota sp. TZLM3-RCL]